MKTKKIVLSFITCLLVMVCALSLTACSCSKECSHEWEEWTTIKEATCTEQGTKEHKCKKCDAKETSTIDALGHEWEEATCTSPKTCKKCLVTEGQTLEHKDENHDHKCDYGCGKNDMGEHSDSSTDNDHVCDYGCGEVLEECVDNNQDHKCDICGKEGISEHDYVLVNTEEATCEKPKINHYKCYCGDIYDEEEGDALGHSINDVTPSERQVSDCEYVLVYICKTCGKEVLGEKIYHHNYIASITTPATCENDGIKTLTCSCGDTKTETIAKNETGHNWEKGNVLNNARTDTCSYCHKQKKVNVYEGTKTNEIKASDLANKELEINNANISLDSGVIDTIGNQNVTISADKLEGENRNDLGLSDEQLNQVGNNPIYNFTINNGTENIANFGDENYVTITLPYTLDENEDVDSIAVWFINVNGELESIKATYNNGYVTFKTNHFSYYTVTRLTPAERCALYGHGYVCYHIEGSCTKDEYDLYVCARCYDKYIDKTPGKYIEAKGHTYEEEIHVATCTQAGYAIYTCKDCGHNYQIRLNATGHNIIIKEKVEATCEESGYTVYKCSNCDYSYTGETVLPLGHNYNVSEWKWSSDYSTASVILTCENNTTHTLELKANVEKNIISGTCSNYTKITYKATCTYNGNTYSEEKVTEEGTPNHNFSSDWSMNNNEHWHECVCGEKTDVATHTFENETITKNPTCIKAGEKTSYCICGATKTEKIDATGVHNYVNGVCTECGDENVETFYNNLVKSFKTIKGFAIKMEDYSMKMEEKDDNLLDSFTLIGSIKQIDIAELYIYVEDGKIEGAATGSAKIFNGPIEDEEAIYAFKAIIHDEYIYVDIKYGQNEADKSMKYKMEIKTIVEDVFDIDVEEFLYYFEFFKETVIPTLEILIDNNSEKVNEIIGKLLNIIFTFKSQEDGSYIASIDSKKLDALQENLSQKTIDKIVDIYFGTGAFNKLTDKIKEIIGIKIPEITSYVDELGIDSKELIKKINELAVKTGADDDFDFNKILNNESFANVTLGMLIFETEDTSYLEEYNELVKYLQEKTLWELLPSDIVEDLQQNFVMNIELLPFFKFKTNKLGEFISSSCEVNNYEYLLDETKVSLNYKISFEVNKKINVTWQDIIKDIDDSFISPSDEVLKDSIKYSNGVIRGTVIYKDKEYDIQNGTYIKVTKIMFDKLLNYNVYSDCDGWYEYGAEYLCKLYAFSFVTIEVDGNAVTLIINGDSKVVEIVEEETTYKAIYEDGTIKEISKSLFDKDYSTNDAKLTDLYFEVFGEEDVTNDTKKFSYYYNPSKKQYAEDSQHELEYNYELQGKTCEDGVKVTITCKNCDYSYSYTSKWCDTERRTIDLSEYSSCKGSIIVYQCKVCGRIDYMISKNFSCDFTENTETEIYDENGESIGSINKKVCSKCGLVYVEKTWTEKEGPCTSVTHYEVSINIGTKNIVNYEDSYERSNHNYEQIYELKGNDCYDGYYVISTCLICGEVEKYTYYGHLVETKTTELSDFGLCGGYIYESSCKVCGEITERYIDDYNCSWKYIGLNEEGYETYICPYCNTTKVEKIFTSEKDENCIITNLYIYTYYSNNKKVYEYQTSYETCEHDYEISYVLYGTSCEDGIKIIYKCKDCGDEYYEEEYEHREILTEKIDLSQYGSTCGGYGILYSCPCGESNTFELEDYNCDFGVKRCDMWIDGVIKGEQYNINGYSSFDCYSYIYACAVTDPADRACSFKFRYAYYWLKDENSCTAFEYETWQFGYNEETNTWLYELTYKTGGIKTYHNYIDSSTSNRVKYDCADCGSYYKECYYYDDDNNLTKYENLISNTLNNGDDKYREITKEYGMDNDYSYEKYSLTKRIKHDGTEYWNKKTQTRELYDGPFGENGRQVESIETSSDGYVYEKEYAYVYYKNNRYDIYIYQGNSQSWNRYDYEYSFEGMCKKTTTTTNSNGNVNVTTSSACQSKKSVVIRNSSCSQGKIVCEECNVCGNQFNFRTYEPRDHSWCYDLTNNIYYCSDCGLENKNGISGNIIMEDLTENYGNNENYVVGYYVKNDIEFTEYISLILSDGTETGIWSGIEFVALDEVQAIAFSKEQVKAWAESNGYTEYEVRLTFVPTESDGNFDYAITFTE